jgi:hypothetical protein
MSAEVGFKDRPLFYQIKHSSMTAEMGFSGEAVLYILTRSFMNADVAVLYVLTHFHELRCEIHRRGCIVHPVLY